MSGLNPFRLRKSEDATPGRTLAPRPSSSIVSPIVASPAPPSAPTPNRPTTIPRPPTEAPRASVPSCGNKNGDDAAAAASSDASSLDPFNYDDADDGNHAVAGTGRGPSRFSSNDDRHLASVSGPSLNPSSPTALPRTAPWPVSGNEEQEEDMDARDKGMPRDSTDVRLQEPFPTPYPGWRNDRSSSTGASQRSVSSNSRLESVEPVQQTDSNYAAPLSDISYYNSDEPKILRSRSKNKKEPPPPPKSHHGRRISSTPTAASSIGTSEPATDSLPSNGSTPQSPLHTLSSSSLSRASQLASDYFSARPESHARRPIESLQRSQSQIKRPPTPPLSRRQSQIRRSKSAVTQANSFRASMPPGYFNFNASTPPGPSHGSLNPPQYDEPESNTQGDIAGPIEVPSKKALSSPTPAPARMPSAKSAKRASLTPSSVPPPPPPPRRAKGSSGGESHTQFNNTPQQGEKEKRAENNEEPISHASNAGDILADLSRLQKEVDDLRGHYENRKGATH